MAGLTNETGMQTSKPWRDAKEETGEFVSAVDLPDIFLGIVSIALLLAIVLFFYRGRRELVTMALSCLARRKRFERNIFRSIELYCPKFPAASPGHPHGEAAVERAECKAALKAWAAATGQTLYHYQKARNEHGSRHEYYSQHDLDMRYAPFHPNPGDVVVLSDTDFYLDESGLSDLVFKSPGAVVFLTIAPEAVVGDLNSAVWTFGPDNVFVQRTGGGAVYRHLIWDFDMDIVTVFRGGCSRVYYVEKSQLGPVHRAVCLVPMVHYGRVGTALLRSFIEYSIFARFRPVNNGLLKIQSITTSGPVIHYGVAGGHHAVTVPLKLAESFELNCKNAFAKPSASGIIHWFEQEGISFGRGEAEILRAVSLNIREGKVNHGAWTSVPGRIRPFNYGNPEEEATTVLGAWCSPFLDEAFTPLNTPENMVGALKYRMVDLRNDMEIDPDLREFALDFARAIVGGVVCTPVDTEVVYERQERPSQRALIDRYGEDNSDGPVSSFVKAECYGTPKDARIITQISPSAKVRLARFTYGMEDLLKERPWYAFGKPLRKVAHRVMEICSSSDSVTPTDFSRWDGRVGKGIRYFEGVFFLLAYPGHFKEVAECLREDMAKRGYARVRTPEGDREFMIWYYTVWCRLSGSMMTALMNSASNAFVAYCSRRLLGHNHEKAWAYLEAKFVCGGDDGLAGDCMSASYLEACDRLGLKATISTVKRGEWGVTFLSRNYTPGVWYGAVDSYCDLKRLLSKFHVCRKTVPVDVIIYARYVTMVRSDSYTPVYSLISKVYRDYVEKYIDVAKVEHAATEHMGYWTAVFRDHEAVDWPQGLAAVEYSDEYLERELPNADLESLNAWAVEVLRRVESDDPEALCFLRAHPLLVQPSEPIDVHEHGYVEITPDNEHWKVKEPLRFAFPRETKGRREARNLIKLAVADVMQDLRETGVFALVRNGERARAVWKPPEEFADMVV
jgi:hypothetical protein